MSRAAVPPLRIAYLPFYVGYYEGLCADFPKEKAEIAQQCAARLAAFGEVLWDGKLLSDAESAEKRGRELAAQKPDVIIVVTTIAVFSGISAAALTPLAGIPVLLWNAQQIQTVGDGYTMVDIVRNTSQIGIQALANVLAREGRRFRVVTGHTASPRTSAELSRFFRIAGAARAVSQARLLAVGDSFALMTDVALESAYAKEHLGAEIIEVTPAELTRAYESVADTAVAADIRAASAASAVAELTDDEFHRSSRLNLALDHLATHHNATAGTLNCHGQNCLKNDRIGVSACYALGIQNNLGRPFTCTGDLPTAVAMLLLKRLSGASMYTEVQVMDEKRRAVIIANSGEGEDAMRRPGAPSQLIGTRNFRGLHGRGAAFTYPLRPGLATLLSFTPTPAGPKPFRLVAAEGEILGESLPDTGSLTGFFRFANVGLHEGYTRWLEAGPVHHAATASGHWAGELRDVADLLGMEFIEVTQTESPRK